ncbi:UBX domain protein Ubx4 [Schizosaccharomyces pombe]|uniref:UBX domain-containing protein 4 n=1 Tax=Schizosaccharomyces pombe (strain 972 / ATCC 24843) TaxID=284812 RepID=UBX4_SCHPO|nr:putative UBX domain protein Ubx4 [Schizosaccharomyces pombe]Q9P7L2.1 RecName: Full=UBX domain-containing protein 4 [Schizosaccharomyces pombe 972h-]CAB76047.1 UBX domain protein Ubx4 (predicted) [Schizosaccharomyces pombe]|eukprot:NP_596591.1 putative UBX domain protein Ubx4 [Schizosaccharomyces pombe]
MATIYACRGFHRVPVKLSPSSTLQEVILSSYKQLGFSDWHNLELLHGDKKVDTSLLLRLSGIINGAKLIVKESATNQSGKSSSSISPQSKKIKVALQLPGAARIIDEASSETSIKQLLERHSLLTKVSHVLINGRNFKSEEFDNPLLLYGIREGSILIRLFPIKAQQSIVSEQAPVSQTFNGDVKEKKNADLMDIESENKKDDIVESFPKYPVDAHKLLEPLPTPIPSLPSTPSSYQNLPSQSLTGESLPTVSNQEKDEGVIEKVAVNNTPSVSSKSPFPKKKSFSSMLAQVKKEKAENNGSDGYDLQPTKSQLELYQSILRKRANQVSSTSLTKSSSPKPLPSSAIVKFDFGNGKSIVHEFSKDDNIETLRAFVASHLSPEESTSFQLTFSNYEALPTTGLIVEHIGRAVVRVHTISDPVYAQR